MAKYLRRTGVRDGYDQWARTYDETANPLVILDRRHTLDRLQPRPRDRILDAGCGTGWNLNQILGAGSWATGMDFSRGMLNVARRKYPQVPLVQADLNADLPTQRASFDAILCALVGEHLTQLPLVFEQFYDALIPGGRMVFSVFHPEMAAAGIEANFERDGVEYRLGAQRYTVDDYVNVIASAGFHDLRFSEYCGDEALIAATPSATKYLNRPLLLVIAAQRSQ